MNPRRNTEEMFYYMGNFSHSCIDITHTIFENKNHYRSRNKSIQKLKRALESITFNTLTLWMHTTLTCYHPVPVGVHKDREVILFILTKISEDDTVWNLPSITLGHTKIFTLITLLQPWQPLARQVCLLLIPPNNPCQASRTSCHLKL